MIWAIMAVLVLWATIVALRHRTSRPVAPSPGPDDDIDRDELEQAEREVKDLETDAKGRPLDDVVGDDWGPGTPKPPYT